MKHFYYSLFLGFTMTSALAQVTLSNGRHVLEISGSVSTYYNMRTLKAGEEDQSKNRFKLRDAQIALDGRVGSDFEYALKVDLADIAANNATQVIDPENPGLMEANMTYKGFHFMEVVLGYGKIYFSRNTLVPFDYSPYWQKPELTRGSIFSTRDVGVTLIKNFWKQRANVYLGAYTGLGEVSLAGDNDASGQLEYVGRLEVSYPSRYRYREIDDRITPIPMVSFGINGRYMNKKLPVGEVFPDGATGDYGLKVINGKRYVYGVDASFQYMGFSGQFEIDQIKSEPQLNDDSLFYNYSPQQTNGYVLSGGYIAQANYFIKRAKTIVSARYEVLDLNDLIAGNSQRGSAAIAYQINGYNAMIKLQYFRIFKEESSDPQKWENQIRLGLNFQFN
jgi:hypothetical protein